jgi:putative endonuclease
MTRTKQIGDFGEDTAFRYLQDKGYIIKDRNFSTRFGEIDIIAEKDDVLIFVEVKTRKNADYGRPAEFVDLWKQRRIIQSAYMYLNGEDKAVRFDVIEVLYRREKTYINHIENAFMEENNENY